MKEDVIHLFLSFFLVISIVGCSGSDESPVNNVEYTPEAVTLNDQPTLDAFNTGSADSTSLKFTGTSNSAAQLQPGQVLAIPPTNLLPNGTLRKVLSVDTNSGDTVVTTEFAALTEYISKAEFQIQGTITPTGIVGSKAAVGSVVKNSPTLLKNAPPGVTLVTAAQTSVGKTAAIVGGGCPTTSDNPSHYIDINNVSIDTDLTLDGCISFEIEFVIDGVIRKGSVEYLKLEMVSTQRSDLSLTSTLIDSNYKKEHVIASINLGAITAGPVVITPEIDIVVGVNGKLNASVSITGANEVSTTTGLEYTSDWQPISQLNTDFESLGPVLNASATASAYSGIELNFLVYGILGVGGTAHGYMQVDADVANDPWWQIYGGFMAGVQAVGEVWDVTLFSYEKPDLINYKIKLAQAESGYVPIPLPPNNLLTLYYGSGDGVSNPEIRVIDLSSGDYSMIADLVSGGYDRISVYDQASGLIYLLDYSLPDNELVKIDIGTGQVTRTSIPLTDQAIIGTVSNGNLLTLYYGSGDGVSSPEIRVIDLSSGDYTMIADLVSGAYDRGSFYDQASGLIYLLDYSLPDNELVMIDIGTGQVTRTSIPLPNQAIIGFK